MRIERQLQGTLNTVFTELIRERGLEDKIQTYTVQEENLADITLKRKSGKTIFFIELKDPTANDGKSVFDNDVLIREVKRAQKHEIKHFGTCNFLACAFFDKDKLYDNVSVNEGFFTLSDITRLSRSYTTNKDIENKLRAVANFYLDRALEIIEKKAIKFSPPDEIFIFKIRKLIEVYGASISDKVWMKYRNDKGFANSISQYTQSQLWNRPNTFDEIEKLTHIALLMLISKLIFYKAYVDNQTWSSLSPMRVGDSVLTPEEIEILIWDYFEEFKEITHDFELLIGERGDIIFQIPFVGDAVIDLVKDVLDTGDHYDFSKIPFDVIGRIFEELIREDERHKLGQYFTPPHVIDLIAAFCIQNENDTVFDPSCGSGTFLVRAYERKKALSHINTGITKTHEELLSEIYGNDLSGYPAYLSMLNLAIRNTKKASYPLIINKDFFSITSRSQVELHDQNGIKVKKYLPKFNAIIGNPPYTKHQDIGAMKGTINKTQIQGLINGECGFNPSHRTSIYAYFFYHSTIFLNDQGYLGYICQNSWLETDYGIDMQRYLLRNFEIVVIIDSEVERFFPTASVNTTIVILKKQNNEDIRNNNIVKFVYLTEPLQKSLNDSNGAENLKLHIVLTEDSGISTHYRINCVKQGNLITHTKWTQFLKAPKVYFDVLEKGKEKFNPLGGKNGVAQIKRGITTGCNDFFLLKVVKHTDIEHLQAAVNHKEYIDSFTEVNRQKLLLVENGFKELWLIENRFLEPVITSPKDIINYNVTHSILKYRLLLVNEERNVLQDNYPFLFDYIRYGERKNLHLGSTVAARKLWYNLGKQKLPDMSFSYMINDVGKTYLGKVFTNDNFQNLYVKRNKKSLFLYMNSTISWLFQQIIIRTNFGDGVAKIQSYELAEMLVPTINLEKLNVKLNATENYKKELGDLKSLKTVTPNRLKLDSAILEAIGFKDNNERNKILLELYRATYQLIEARLKKAQSQKSVKNQRNKIELTVYIDQLNALLVESKFKARNNIVFAKKLEKLVNEITSESRLKKKILDAYWRDKYGKAFNEKQIAKQDQMSLF